MKKGWYGRRISFLKGHGKALAGINARTDMATKIEKMMNDNNVELLDRLVGFFK